MNISSNTPPPHITTCHVQFTGALVQQHYRKTKSRPVCTCFPHTEIPLTHCRCHIEAVYFKKQDFYRRNLHANWNYSLGISRFFTHTLNRMSIVTTHRDSETTCVFCQVNECFNTPEDGNR
jgi:hypothetical protein